MQSVSEYNAERDFHYELRESRLKRCAKLIESLPPGQMLDVGCSTGDWALLWKARGWSVAGADLDPEHVRIANERGVETRACDLNAQGLPYPDGAFDLVFAGEVIEHIVDTDAFVSEVRRCLKPGGHLLLTTPNLASFENRVRILFGVYPAWTNYNLEGSGHVRSYTPGVLKKQLRAHGFRIVTHTGNWVPVVPQRMADDIRLPALAVTGPLFPSLAVTIIVLAQREEI